MTVIHAGTLAEFRRLICLPIENERQSTLKLGIIAPAVSTEAVIMGTLKQFLAPVLIRRTHSSVGKNTLPPRRDVTLYCELAEQQRTEYDSMILSLLRYICKRDLC
jgi:SNF2 family DNA or RNA helicase